MVARGEPTGRVRELGRTLDALEHEDDPEAVERHRRAAYESTLRLLEHPDGLEALYGLASRLDASGVFAGSDWAWPHKLQPGLVRESLLGPPHSVAVEALSALRMLAIAEARVRHPDLAPEEARRFLESVLALNLDLLFPESTEASRTGRTARGEGVRRLCAFLAERMGLDAILAIIVDEVERVLEQRPIMVHRVATMLRAARHAARGRRGSPESRRRARRLLDALEGPTRRARQAGVEGYAEALDALTPRELAREGRALAASMRGTGLVAPQHAILLRRLARDGAPAALAAALGLDAVGRDSLEAYEELVRRVIDVVVHPATAQSSVLGLACLLDRGVLFFPPVAPSLWRLVSLEIRADVAEALRLEVGASEPPPPEAILLAGALAVLGQPLGVGQGDNPTCQSARAISLWAQVDAGFLMDLVVAAARDGEIDMHFEGQLLRSTELQPGSTEELHTELDPVSLVLVPHLDRIYWEMGRRVLGRQEDGHRWINPEFHGWWVHRGFATAIQYATGDVVDFAGFVRLFFATYHPDFNGGRVLVYPQPAGIAATDPHGSFVGWHAVSIQRVTVDGSGAMRVYFFDPNDEGRQDWGQDIRTSTAGHGEEPGESSLPFAQFAARLYVFHYDPREQGDTTAVPEEAVGEITALARESWGAELAWHDLVPV